MIKFIKIILILQINKIGVSINEKKNQVELNTKAKKMYMKIYKD